MSLTGMTTCSFECSVHGVFASITWGGRILLCSVHMTAWHPSALLGVPTKIGNTIVRTGVCIVLKNDCETA